jgi:hypothetical protein
MRTTSKTNLKKRAIAAAHDLSIVMRGKILLPGDDAYASSRQVWNGAVDHRPALFALCGNAQDVQAAVRVARSHGLPLSVRGGGHDWAGLALRHNGLVIELSKMRNVTLDAVAKLVTVAGGATAADVSAAVSQHDPSGKENGVVHRQWVSDLFRSLHRSHSQAVTLTSSPQMIASRSARLTAATHPGSASSSDATIPFSSAIPLPS